MNTQRHFENTKSSGQLDSLKVHLISIIQLAPGNSEGTKYYDN